MLRSYSLRIKLTALFFSILTVYLVFSAAAQGPARNEEPGSPGPMTVGHPAACRALGQAAEAVGARVVRGAGRVTVTPVTKPAEVLQ